MWKNVTFPFISSVSTKLARDNSEEILAFRHVHIYFCDLGLWQLSCILTVTLSGLDVLKLECQTSPILAHRGSNTHQTLEFRSNVAMRPWKTFYFILTNWYLWFMWKIGLFFSFFFFWQNLLHNLIFLLFFVLFFQLYTVFYMIKGIVFKPKIKGAGSLFLS